MSRAFQTESASGSQWQIAVTRHPPRAVSPTRPARSRSPHSAGRACLQDGYQARAAQAARTARQSRCLVVYARAWVAARLQLRFADQS